MGNPLAGIDMDSNRSQFMARQRIESQINLPRLFAAIDADPGIVGAGVVYIDADFNVITLREFKPICSIKPKRIILREAQKYIAPAQFVEQVKTDPREERLRKEVFDMGLSCGAAVIERSITEPGTALLLAASSMWAREDTEPALRKVAIDEAGAQGLRLYETVRERRPLADDEVAVDHDGMPVAAAEVVRERRVPVA